MPDLPRVSQEFDADASAYVAAIEEMIERNQALVRSVEESVAQIDAALATLDDKSIGITLNKDELLEQIEEVKEELDAAFGEEGIPVTLNTDGLLEQIAEVREEIEAGGAVKIPVMLDDEDVIAEAAGLREVLAEIPPVELRIELGGSAEVLAQIAGIKAALADLDANDLKNTLANLGTALSAAGAGAEQMKSGLDGVSNDLDNASRSAQSFHSWWSVLTKDVQLWGGAFDSVDKTLISQVAVWHIALDGLLEATIAVTGAVIALGAAAAALAPTAQAVYTHLKAIQTVSDATGQSIPPLTGKFKELQQAMQPQGIELYGSALNALSGGNMQALSQAISGVVSLLDKWGAEIDIWMSKSDGMAGAIQKGTGYLSQLGSLIADIVLAIQNLMAAEPGVAHFVLDFVDGFAKAAVAITGFSPLLDKLALAIHGVMLWGGLLVSIFANLAVGLLKPISSLLSLVAGTQSASAAISDFEKATGDAATPIQKLQLAAQAAWTALSSLGSSIATWGSGIAAAMSDAEGGVAKLGAGLTAALTGVDTDVTAAAVSMDEAAAEMAALAEEAGVLDAEFMTLTAEIRASSAALMAMDEEVTVASGGLGLVVGAAAAAAVGLVVLIKAVSDTKTATQQWVSGLQSAVSQARGLAQIGTTYSALAQVTNALSQSQDQLNRVTASSATIGQAHNIAMEEATQKTSQLSTAQQQLQGQFTTEISNVAALASQYKISYVEAAQLAADAGVSLTTSLKGNSSEAQVARQEIQNYVTGLTGMTSPMSALGSDINAVTIAAGLQQSKVGQLTQAWSTVMSLVQGPSNGFIAIAQSLDQFSADAQTANARMTGLGGAATTTTRNVTDASTKLQGDFNNTVSAMQTYTNSLTTAAAVTGNSGPLVQGIKDEIAILIPMAGSNANAAAQIKVLWQEAGGSASDSMSQIATAVNGTKNPLQNLQTLTGQVSLSLANLGQDAQKLAQTITSSLNQTLVAQAEQLTGVSAKAGTYLQALQQFGPNSAQAQAALGQLNNATSTATQLASQAASGVTALSGDTQKLGDTASSVASTGAAQLSSALDAINSKGGTTAQTLATQLMQAITGTGTESGTTASHIKSELVTALEAAGVQANTAKTDAQNLYTALEKLNGLTVTSTVQIEEKVVEAADAGDNQSLPGGAPGATGAATGWRIPGYGGGDIIPAMLEPGEAVVPKHLVSAVAPFLSSKGVPGFSSGTTSVPNIITGGTTREAMKAIAQDTAMLAKDFPIAAIPAPAAGPGQFMGDWLPSSMMQVAPPPPPPAPAGTPTGGGDTTGHPHHRRHWDWGRDEDRELHNHISVNLDGQRIWEGMQKNALKYGLRNSGQPTGIWRPT